MRAVALQPSFPLKEGKVEDAQERHVGRDAADSLDAIAGPHRAADIWHARTGDSFYLRKICLQVLRELRTGPQGRCAAAHVAAIAHPKLGRDHDGPIRVLEMSVGALPKFHDTVHADETSQSPERA
jgi:hypothetical protein